MGAICIYPNKISRLVTYAHNHDRRPCKRWDTPIFTHSCTWDFLVSPWKKVAYIYFYVPSTVKLGSEGQHLITQTTFQTGSKLDFIQLRRIAERFREALQQCAWDFNHIGLLLGH